MFNIAREKKKKIIEVERGKEEQKSNEILDIFLMVEQVE